LVPAKAGE